MRERAFKDLLFFSFLMSLAHGTKRKTSRLFWLPFWSLVLFNANYEIKFMTNAQIIKIIEHMLLIDSIWTIVL